MNTRNAIVPLILLPVLLGLVSCGGGGTYGTVCSAAASKLFQKCDQHSAADQQLIYNAVQGMGGSISFAEIATASEGAVESDCEQGLSELKPTITDAEAKEFVDSLNDLTSCQEVVTAIQQATNAL
ncbi:MAG: hypothetical protein V1495_02390 [Pseudomonadota bacterium]